MSANTKWGEGRRTEQAHRERVRAIPLFAGLDDAEVDLLDAVLTEVRVDAGRRVTVTNGVGREFAVILEGLACVVRAGVEVARLGPHAFFGEHALLTRQPRSADVVAVTPMRLLVAGSAEFARMCREVPAIAARLAAAEQERQGGSQ